MIREVKAVVIVEALNPKTGLANFMQCLGVFEGFDRAYGKALIYLSEIAFDGEGGEYTITPLQDLEGETGFALYMRNSQGQITDAVYILHADASEERRKEGDAT